MNQKVSLKYYLLTTRTTIGKLPIYLRITANRQKSELYTGYNSTLKEWSQEDQLIKNNPIVNQELSKMKSKVYELIIDLEKTKKPISASILKSLLSGKESIDISLIQYFTKHLSEIQIRNEIKNISIAKYKQSINTLKRYKLNVTQRSNNLKKELNGYKWKQNKDGKLDNEPVDFLNHAIDALRYASLNILDNPTSGRYAFL